MRTRGEGACNMWDSLCKEKQGGKPRPPFDKIIGLPDALMGRVPHCGKTEVGGKEKRGRRGFQHLEGKLGYIYFGPSPGPPSPSYLHWPVFDPPTLPYCDGPCSPPSLPPRDPDARRLRDRDTRPSPPKKTGKG